MTGVQTCALPIFYLEAKFLGAPVLVPEGSWMAEDVRKLGNGLVFAETTPSCIADCILQARREIVRLREAAARCGEAFSAWNGADRCVDATEALFADPVP